MTDMRFPERWLTKGPVLHLRDDEFRAFVYVTTWAVAQGDDGAVQREDLKFVVGGYPTAAHMAELVRVGLYETTERGWQMVRFAETQTTRSVLESAKRVRELNRERARRHREKEANSPEVTRDVTRTDGEEGGVTRDVARDSPRTGQGLGQGQASVQGRTYEISPSSSETRLPQVRPCGHPGTPPPSGICGRCDAEKRAAGAA